MKYNTSNEIEVGDTVRVVSLDKEHEEYLTLLDEYLGQDGVVVDSADHRGTVEVQFSDGECWYVFHEWLEIMEGREERELRESLEQIIIVEIHDEQMAERQMGAKCLELCKSWNLLDIGSNELLDGISQILKLEEPFGE